MLAPFSMSRATPQTLNFAKRLMVYETEGRKPPKTSSQAAFQAREKLRLALVTLMGNLCFRALLSRALVLASAEVPWLSAAHVESGGVLQGLGIAQAQLGPDELLISA